MPKNWYLVNMAIKFFLNHPHFKSTLSYLIVKEFPKPLLELRAKASLLALSDIIPYGDRGKWGYFKEGRVIIKNRLLSVKMK